VIPGGAYEGQSAAVPTIGVATVMVIHKDVPEELVYQMAKVFWESHEQFLEVSPVWKDVRLDDALVAVTIPVHPGAQRFYDEMGVTQKGR
jgi:TRAP transporter TAXI family solute receptor